MIIAVANQKGGQGKSTTAQAIANGAAAAGLKTLAIDVDPQTNLTYSMGGNPGDVGLYELMTGTMKPAQVIQHTKQGDIISGSFALAGADILLTGEDRVELLKRAIKPIRRKYDLIVIDCPPTLNILLMNALTAADKVIIPLTADMFALQGLYLLVNTIHGIQEKYNPELQIGGVLFVKHNLRTILSRDLTTVIKNKCAELGVPVYESTIREGVAAREAQVQRESLFDYAPRAGVTKDYLAFVKELGL